MPPPSATALARQVLVVNDEHRVRAALVVCLEALGCAVTPVDSAEDALGALRRQLHDLVFLGLRLRDVDGLELLTRLLATRPNLAVIVCTPLSMFEGAVEAIKRGAMDYVAEPFTPAQIRHVVEQVEARRVLRHRVVEAERQLAAVVPEADLMTEAPGMRAVLEVIATAASADAPVLLRGESGTGKGVLARVLHSQGPRHARPFVTVNCPTLSEELLASELFGHAKGAFTGAVRDQAGRVEAAEGGTLFLDEIGEISPGLQAKLLRFLQDKCFERVGENRTRAADVRVVAASNRDLDQDVRSGHFREDLLYRLNVIELRVPPLRERPQDILLLARRALEFFAHVACRPTPELAPPTAAALLAHSWPGNVRELRNAMERAVILSRSPVLDVDALPMRIAQRGEARLRLGGDFTLEELEREHIRAVLARAPTLEEAARVLGIDSSTLWRKRKRHAMD